MIAAEITTLRQIMLLRQIIQSRFPEDTQI